MIFTPLDLQGAYLVQLEKREDPRGFFARAFCAEEFSAHGLPTEWAQMNLSLSRDSGTIRGLHFQRSPKADAKLVRCVGGAVLDVIIDLRAGSPSFGGFLTIELSSENRNAVFLPTGFGHGFQVLQPHSELFYMHTAPYTPKFEGGVHPLDPEIGIPWPLDIAEMSSRDRELPRLSELEPL